MTHLAPPRTPRNTIHARISTDIAAFGEQSRFVRAGPGLYALREGFSGIEYSAPSRTPSSMQSDVLVFHSDFLDKVGRFHGVKKDYRIYAQKFLNGQNAFFIPRIQAEATNIYKQIVSYVIIQYQGQLLRYIRGKVTTITDYLYGEYSLGFGGHVEKSDLDLFTYDDVGFRASVIRELREEVGIDLRAWSKNTYTLRMVGVLNDDSSPLGQKHFAFLMLLDIKSEHFRKHYDFAKGEKSVNDLRLIDISSLSDEFAGYEYWSKLVVQTFFWQKLAITCHIESSANASIRQAKYILVVGFVGSGKSEACRLLAEQFGYTLVPCSRVMSSLIADRPFEDFDRKTLQNSGLNLVTEPDGHLRLAKAIVGFIQKNSGRKFVLDGLRYPETFEAVQSLLGQDVIVIYIETTIDRLYQNFLVRDGAFTSMEEFIDLISHPVERAVERFVHMADVVIYNHGSWASYIEALQEFFERELL